MSTSELAELEALLERALPDPSGYFEKVLAQLVDRLGTAAPQGGPTVVEGFESVAHQELVDHNLLLAAALGACECWGADPDCEQCAGAGTAGWSAPDPDLFSELVTPAVARVAAGTRRARRHTDNQPADVPTRDDTAGGSEERNSDDHQRMAG